MAGFICVVLQMCLKNSDGKSYKCVRDNTFIPFLCMVYHIYPTRALNMHLGFASVDISYPVVG